MDSVILIGKFGQKIEKETLSFRCMERYFYVCSVLMTMTFFPFKNVRIGLSVTVNNPL